MARLGSSCSINSGLSKHPLKVKIFGWLALKGRICTKDNLKSRGWTGDELCVFCGEALETVNHLLVGCPTSMALLGAQLTYKRLLCDNFTAVHLWENSSQIRGCTGKRERGILLASWWSIWPERNRRIFENKRGNVKHLLDSVRALRTLWVSLC